ncbi:MAG TPA: hypothetical protein VHT00_00630 [Stellaceae bacterium]|nr:hypothetical protein [Stellaceae bacterium]
MRVARARDGELAALAAAWQGAVGRDRPRGAAGKRLRPRLAEGDRRGLAAALLRRPREDIRAKLEDGSGIVLLHA